MADFFDPQTGTPLSRIEMERKFEINLNEEMHLEFRYILRMARRCLGLNDDYRIPVFRPFQPLLINIANLCKKGCSNYYRLLRKKNNLNTTLEERESKWHQELNCILGTEYWNKIYSLTASIKNENRMKFLQFQINRNSLFTNYKVNKFKNNISPFCSFCTGTNGNNQPHFERISHLFYECHLVFKLWEDVVNWIRTFNFEIPLEKKKIIFGIQEQKISSVPNYLILCVKYFIWKSKFQGQHPTLNSFKIYLKN